MATPPFPFGAALVTHRCGIDGQQAPPRAGPAWRGFSCNFGIHAAPPGARRRVLASRPRRSSRAKPRPTRPDWPRYARDLGGTRFSPLDQINAGNVAPARYRLVLDRARLKGGGSLVSSATPIAVGGVLYYPAGRRGGRAGGRYRQGNLALSGERRGGPPRGVLLGRRRHDRPAHLLLLRLGDRRAQRRDRPARHRLRRQGQGRARRRPTTARRPCSATCW